MSATDDESDVTLYLLAAAVYDYLAAREALTRQVDATLETLRRLKTGDG